MPLLFVHPWPRAVQRPTRRAFTVMELVLVCVFIGLCAGVALPRSRRLLDGVRLRQATHEVASAVTIARAAAIRRGTYARIVVDDAAGSIRVEADADTLVSRDLTRQHRVALHASRDTILYAPNGMGFGIANSTIVVSIGQKAETVTVSRLGRMRISY